MARERTFEQHQLADAIEVARVPVGRAINAIDFGDPDAAQRLLAEAQSAYDEHLRPLAEDAPFDDPVAAGIRSYCGHLKHAVGYFDRGELEDAALTANDAQSLLDYETRVAAELPPRWVEYPNQYVFPGQD